MWLRDLGLAQHIQGPESHLKYRKKQTRQTPQSIEPNEKELCCQQALSVCFPGQLFSKGSGAPYTIAPGWKPRSYPVVPHSLHNTQEETRLAHICQSAPFLAS